MSTEQEHLNELLDYLLQVDNRDDMEKALSGLLTPTEFTEVIKRLQIFKLLREGMPQRQIAEKLGVGIATVTRGSRALKAE